MKIKQLNFPENQYYNEAQAKKQIVLHHTGSGRGIDGDYKHWIDTPSRISVCVIIDRDGTINQLFGSQFWGPHLGTSLRNNNTLDKISIGVELDAWGPVAKIGAKFYSYTGSEVHSDDVVEYKQGFKTMPNSGFFAKHKLVNTPARFYHKYSEDQIQSVVDLCRLWNKRYSIPLTYNEDMWAVSAKATRGVPGIWSHVSYRADKTDCHPQPELIEALKSLSK